MDLRGGRERATLSEQMTKLQNSMQNRDRKRAQGRQQRKREHSDDSSGDEEGKGRTRRRAVEHGLLNLGTGALAEGAAHAGFSWRCELCQITLSSEASKHQHLQGAAHLKAEKRARAMEEAGRMDPVQQQKAQAALAMAGWTAGSQGSSEYVSKLVVKEVVKAVDHYGAEIKAKGLMPHCPDSGLVHRGAGYKVIQGKMSSHLGRPSGDKHRIAKTPAKPLNTGSNLPLQGSVAATVDFTDFAPPMPSGLAQEVEVALPSSLLRKLPQAPGGAGHAANMSHTRQTHGEGSSPTFHNLNPVSLTKNEIPLSPPVAASDDSAPSVLGGLLGAYNSNSDDSDCDSDI